MSQWIEYRKAIELIRQHLLTEALSILLGIVESHPKNVLAWAAAGHIYAEANCLAQADLIYLRVRKLLRGFGGGLSDLQEGDLRSLELAAARALQAEGRQLYAVLDRLRSQLGVDESKFSRLRRSIEAYSQGARPVASSDFCQPQLFHIADIPEISFPDIRDYPRVAAIAEKFLSIREELISSKCFDEMLVPYVDYRPDSHSAAQWKELNGSRVWSAFHLCRNGVLNPDAAAAFPQTLQALREAGVMEIPGYAPNAMFSVLEAGGFIKPHFGSINGRLIVHLPIEVPENCGYLEVGGVRREWLAGQPILFDDSLKHCALNRSDRRRIVLIFDVWHHALTQEERTAVQAILEWMASSSADNVGFAA